MPPNCLPDWTPLAKSGIVRHSSIMAMDPSISVDVFDPATGLRTLEGLLIQGRPIPDSAGKPANVNVVEKVLLEGPFLRCVVDFEADVGRHPTRLRRRNISANYVASGKFIPEVTVRERRGC